MLPPNTKPVIMNPEPPPPLHNRRPTGSPPASCSDCSTTDMLSTIICAALPKARVIVANNYRRWIFQLFLLTMTTVLFLQHWHTCAVLLVGCVLFEFAVIRIRSLRFLRNQSPLRTYLCYTLFHVVIWITFDKVIPPYLQLTSSSAGVLTISRLQSQSGIGSIVAPPQDNMGQGTVDRSAVMVSNGDAVRVPFSRAVDATLRSVVEGVIGGKAPYVTGDDVSIIIPVRDESMYISKTIMYTVQNTPKQYLREFIVVDDGSEEPIADVLDRELPRNVRGIVKVLRYETKEGLIRARIAGADLASSSNIFFLDGHCRPKPGWVEPLIRHLKSNYKRIACPVIQDIAAETWEETGTSGFKMMFEWNFEFGWYDDLTDEVPVSAGGILAMTKKWWEESGKYDAGMLEWGGENIEQSIRVWLCGGEIYVVRNSQIGHIFNRPAKPNPENKLVRQVQTNQKRAALVWLDGYYKYFEKYHPVVKELEEGPGLEERVALRHKLNCMPFQWYVDRFRVAFERKGLLDDEFYHIQHASSRWCLSVAGPDPVSTDSLSKTQHHVILSPCQKTSTNQQWMHVGGNRLMYHRQTKKCLDSYASQRGSPYRDLRPIVYECDWNAVFQLQNRNQFWQFDRANNGRIFAFVTGGIATLTGHDVYPVRPNKSLMKNSLCISADAQTTNVWDMGNDRVGSRGLLPRDIYYKPCEPKRSAAPWEDTQEFRPLWG
eukprot:GHVS01075785.1.p1 GENE.GHVS01075785.1~~GHVS01075785.1.p1  ORF type:complete len:715 (-),score=59.51 GHVS01075785.1:1244-3388(-)